MVAVYEGDGPLEDGEVDGMAEFAEGEDDVLSTDWDLAYENPPHMFLSHVDLHGLKKDK